MAGNRDHLTSRSVKDWKKSARHGAGEWLSERLSSVALVGLGAWALYSVSQIASGGYQAARHFLSDQTNAGLMALLLLIAAWHLFMGLKVIIDDYLRGPMRGLLVFVSFFGCAVMALGVGLALFVIHQGGMV